MRRNEVIKVIHIVFSLEYGGLERIAIELAKHLNSGRYNVSICCLDTLGELTAEARANGIEVFLVKRRPGPDFTLPIRLAHILRKRKADVVHTHNMGPLLYGTLGARLAGVPVVINTRHGRAPKRTNAYIWKANDAIIAISQDARDEIVKWNHIRLDKLKVIYNGIDNDRYSSEKTGDTIRQNLNIESGAMVVGTVARLSEEKDQFTLLDAFAKVISELQNVYLVIAGDGPLRKDLESHASDLGISQRVRFLGFRDDISSILRILDLFVLSSTSEGISLTLLEAMAAGLPIVATKVGGNPEVVIDGTTGFLVAPKKPAEMAEAIYNLLSDKKLAREMGDAGKKRVEEKFSLERMAKEYKEVYEECLARKGVVPESNLQ